MAEGKKPRLTSEQWVGIKARYEGGESPYAIAKEFRIAASTVRAHIKREGWTRKANAPTPPEKAATPPGGSNEPTVKDEVRSNVVSILTRKALEQLEESGEAADLNREISELEKLYIDMERESLLLAIETTKRARVNGMQANADGKIIDPISGQEVRPLRSGAYTSEAGEIKDAVAAARQAADLSRELRGKRSGVASIADGEDDGKPTVIELEIVDGPGELEAS